MRIRCNTTLISEVLLSLFLVTNIRTGLELASTWRVPFYECNYGQAGHFSQTNPLMFLGFYSLGFDVIGMIVLWTGYRKQERWSWFVMLTLLLFFVFPSTVLPTLLLVGQAGFKWAYYFNMFKEALEGDSQALWVVYGQFAFPVMVVALLLPIKAFFWRRPTPQVMSDSQNPEV